MNQEDINNREKRIRHNFASIFLLMAAIAISAVAGIIYIVKLLT